MIAGVAAAPDLRDERRVLGGGRERPCVWIRAGGFLVAVLSQLPRAEHLIGRLRVVLATTILSPQSIARSHAAA